jgi:hypothetical protein
MNPNLVLDSTMLTALSPSALEVADVDVRRLRDDPSEILSGDEIAFVAVAKFRITADALSTSPFKDLADQLDLAAGDDLFYIDRDAEIRSEKVQLVEDDVVFWLNANYGFTFTLNGTGSPAFQPLGSTRLKTLPKATSKTLPWLTKLNTVVVKDDYVDVDVKIGSVSPTAVVPVPMRGDLQLHGVATFEVPGGQPVSYDLSADVSCTEDDLRTPFVLTIPREDRKASLEMRLVFKRPQTDQLAATNDRAKHPARKAARP